MDVSSFNFKFISVWLLLYTILFINSVMGSLNNVDDHCNKKDMDTLLHFKEGVIDPSGLLSSWSIKQDCCEWTGVLCDNVTGRVIELNLPCHIYHPEVLVYGEEDDKSHCLGGEFNLSHLLDLDFLSYLIFSNNDFNSVASPADMSKVLHKNSSNLHYLDLSYNYDILIHNISWISHLSSLEYLNLNGIDLHLETDWLPLMTMLPSLLELHLQSCQLENIYSSLQYVNFTSLKVLDIGNNNFVSYLPNWLFNLSCGISHINISNNQIHGQLPKTLPNLGQIKSLLLYRNALSGSIPNWFGQLEQLQELDLSYNSFSGSIPSSFGNVSSLKVLNLVYNHLSGNLPQSLGQLFKLEILRVAENRLTGVVSERNLLSLINLKYLSLGSPSLIFDFDPKWVPPFQLEHIWLEYYVSEKLPSWLFNQSSLKILFIVDSNASFEPLDKFWNFSSQLDVLFLTNTTVNADMSNVLLNMKFAWLNSNNLRGGLPRLSPRVIVLDLYNNFLSGSISPLLCHNMTQNHNLMHLNLDANLLSGELTNCWNDWKSLLLVSLENNNLTGKIPDSISSLSNLISLYLNDNKLFGEVPSSLKYCKSLQILNLGNNNFVGAIPMWMGQGLKGLQLRSNQFNGNIPIEICQLHDLMVVDFASNRLSGPIPNCLHKITTMFSIEPSMDYVGIRVQIADLWLEVDFTLAVFVKDSELQYDKLFYVIDLSSNKLFGNVPSEIFMLTRLQSLNLSHNQLVGTIPEEIGNLKGLESIDLSSNNLSGKIPQTMPSLSFLGALNLSFNNFMGKIPSGTQLQGFTNLSYMGNPLLCGPPLTEICPQDEKTHNTKHIVQDDDDDESKEVHSWFYMGLGIGFTVGYLGVIAVIFFNRTCRHAYFKLLNRLYDMVIH